MKTLKKIKLKTSQIVTIVLSVFFAVVMIVADCFVNKYSAIISTFFGVAEQLEGDTESIEQAAKSGDEVVRKMGNEGVVLLKNELNASGNPTLPLPESTNKINIFGWGATDSGFLLAGNGSGRSYVHEDLRVGLLDAFKESKFDYNEEIIQIYENWTTDQDADWGETANWNNRFNTKLKEPVTADHFTDDVITRAKAFSDTALIVLSRYSGEFIGRLYDTQKKHGLPEDPNRSFNEITTEEESLIKMCTANFANVIILFNTGSVMDMDFLDDEANFGKIGAALNAGYMGQSGATAIPKILKGDVTPSAKLADTVLYDAAENEVTRVNPVSNDLAFIEDIYLGYKFYETADVEGYFEGKKKFEGTSYEKTGYDAVVHYPFGYGLSYTKFDWEIESVSLPDGSELAKDSEMEIKVKVTNSGTENGKDVVELYLTAEYHKGGIEKAAVQLIDFAKTPELKPTQSCTLTFNFTPYELASYDCYDANENDITGWELDVGSYELKLMTDSHTMKEMEATEAAPQGNKITYRVEEAFRYRRDPVSKGLIRNRYTGDNAYGDCPLDGSALGTDWTYLSRADFAATVPTQKAASPASGAVAPYASYVYDDYAFDGMPTTGVENNLRLVTREDGSFATAADFTGGGSGVTLKYNEELIMKLGNPEYWDDPVWNQLLDQLSLNDLKTLVEDGGYGTRAIESIGKPVWLDYDGPSGFNRTNLSPNVPGSKMTALPAENLVAQTWNKELVYQSGQIIGMDGQNFGLSGIYAPGVNLHREVLNGRNYEYYSEDGVLSGYLAASFVGGAASNGIYAYVKHLALYDSSSYTSQRVWCTEQNFRENYLKPFEIAIKKGGANAVMVSFNKIGPTWAGSNQAMLDGILRTEFGFKGVVVTDYDDGSDGNMKLPAAIRAGLNTQLNPLYGKAGANGTISTGDVVEMNLARSSAKSIIYASCNTYYTAKTNTGSGEYSVEITAPRAIVKGFNWWVIVVVLINVIGFGIIIWRVLAAFLPRKQKAVAEGADPDSSDNSEIGKGKKKRFGRKKKVEEDDPFEVVPGNACESVAAAPAQPFEAAPPAPTPAATDGKLEARLDEIEGKIEKLSESLARIEALLEEQNKKQGSAVVRITRSKKD